MADVDDILRQYWGYDSFRPLQREIIDSVISGHDTLAILPTGGGKSLTFQIPALALPGTALVISPLIALMSDQVQNLRKRNIRAVVIHSGLTHDRIYDILEQASYGAYDLLYVSPERLTSEFFRTRLRYININLIAVDEAHCISQWGYDFRPSYLKIAEIREFFPEAPVLALTASATQYVADDIVNKLSSLSGDSFVRFRSSVRRDNLVYVVRSSDDRLGTLVNILNAVPGTSIVYCRTREGTQKISDCLADCGFSVSYYHAGLDRDEREKRQAEWISGKLRVLCATNAFGMGIDKADVRTVIHFDIPDTLEAYYQEAGRAGRDGQKSYAVLLAPPSSVDALLHRHEKVFPTKDFIRVVYQRLAEYFIIGEGSGLDAVFPFSLEEFCHATKMQYAAVRASLKVLEWSGYITLTEEFDDASKMQILVSPSSEELWTRLHIGSDPILDIVMRLYTGVFTDRVHINEDKIAVLLGIDRNDVYNHLAALDRAGVVKYVPFRRSPLLIYNIERKDSAKLYIPDEAYEQRIRNFRDRLLQVHKYVIDGKTCRSLLLEHYFGETSSTPCRHCDNCLSRK